MRAILLFLVCVSQTATALPAGALAAQQPAARLVGEVTGVSWDWFMYENARLVALTYRSSRLHPRQVEAELGVSVFPQLLAARVIALAPDVGAAYNLPLPGGSLLLKAGGSAIGAIGTAGILFVPGFHLGGTVVVKTGARSGLRLDVIRHYYLPIEEKLEPLWSIGLGFAVLPRIGS